MDFTTNYCGMYWSDGKIQSSVIGSSEPVNELDAACQEHDASYSIGKDLEHADLVFYDKASKLGVRGKIYANLVYHGNKAGRMFLAPLALLFATGVTSVAIQSQVINNSLRGSNDEKVEYGPTIDDEEGTNAPVDTDESGTFYFADNRNNVHDVFARSEVCEGAEQGCNLNENFTDMPVRVSANKSGKKTQKVTKVKKAASAPSMSKPKNPTFGSVSTINTAPVAIGNSMSGFTARTMVTADGLRVVGRDYAFTPAATGSVTTWALTGGMPLTPCCMPSTILRNFVQMYNKFKINACLFHYITSSSTATTGDVVFYYSKNAASQLPNCTSNSFLPYVMSDSNTVIGPQWTNHTIKVNPSTAWLSTDYGVDATDEVAYSAGDIFLYSKTSSTESPGYVVFDYDITFKTLSTNPRSGYLPSINIQWTPTSFTDSNVYTKGNAIAVGSGTSFIGGTSITAFSASAGDVHEFVIDSTNSTYSGATASTSWEYKAISTETAFVISDGLKVYTLCDTGGSFRLYWTLANAITNTAPIAAGATATFANVYRGYAKLVTSSNSAFLKQAY